jgi:iron(III) transport system substrate-binding protein
MTLTRSPRTVRRLTAGLALTSLLLAACGGDSETATTGSNSTESNSTGSGETRTVTVYTGRHYGIEPVFAEFTAATGIEVRFTTGSDPELRERLSAEGANTPADVIMTADAANIELADQAGLLAPIDSEVLRSAIPETLRSANDTWFSLSRRLRVIMYSTERVSTPPTTYAGLGDPEWDGRLCLRPGTHPYTQSLVAALILNDGRDGAEAIVEGWVANDPLYINSDTEILRAIEAGDCDVALTNTYYLGRLKNEDPAYPVAVSWPEQQGAGAHVNVSTIALTANAAHPEEAIALIEWLATDGHAAFASANFEYPADPDVASAELIVEFGTHTSDETSVRELGRLNAEAVDVLTGAGYE